MTDTHKVLVYGTLRYGFRNHHWCIAPRKPENIFKLEGYSLYDLGAYPTVVKDYEELSPLVVEAYTLDGDAYNYIRNMEIGAGYKEIDVTIDGEVYKMYVFENLTIDCRLIESGDYSYHMYCKGY